MQSPSQSLSGTLQARGKQRDRVDNQECLVPSKVKKDWRTTSRRKRTIIGSSNASPLVSKNLNQPPIKTAAKNDVKDCK